MSKISNLHDAIASLRTALDELERELDAALCAVAVNDPAIRLAPDEKGLFKSTMKRLGVQKGEHAANDD